jgi:hypothetical protein
VIVQPEESAAARDVEPGIRVDEQATHGRLVVLVELGYESEKAAEAELLELLDGRIRGAKQLEFAFEDLAVALRERPRIGVPRAFSGALQEQRAQVGIQRGAIFQLRETEGHREKGLNLNHPAIATILQASRMRDTKKDGGLEARRPRSNNRSIDQKSTVSEAKT